MSQLLGGGGAGILLIQRGTITIGAGTTSNTATVTAVVVADCVLRFLGCTYSVDAVIPERSTMASIVLTNTTTLTAQRVSSADGGAVTVSYELIQYAPGVIKSRQAIQITLSGVASNTQTITSVDTTKSTLEFHGATTDDANGYGGRYQGDLVLTNATTVTAARGIGSATLNVYGQVTEFYQ